MVVVVAVLRVFGSVCYVGRRGVVIVTVVGNCGCCWLGSSVFHGGCVGEVVCVFC